MNDMFNLEQSIADWRRQMLGAGIKTPVPLEELEIHLREDVERQVRSGTAAQQAFEIAVRKIGQGHALKQEFTRAGQSAGAQLVKLAAIACLVIACLFSLLILSALSHHAAGWLFKLLGWSAIAATFLSWRYGYRFLPVIRNQPVRTAIGGACCLAGIVWIQLCIHFVPHFMVHPAGSDLPFGQFMAAFLWAWNLMAMLGGMAYGLEKAAWRNDECYV
jgi:hypothetical protein